MDSQFSQLEIPGEFARYSLQDDKSVISRLDSWRDNAHHNLLILRDMGVDGLSLDIKSKLAFIASTFDGPGDWVTPTSRSIAQEILQVFNRSPDTALLAHILMHMVKPIFQATPHPSLHMETGRRLPRPAGGPMASQDHYDSQEWKAHPGIANTLSWWVRTAPPAAYETLWHLLIPPVMTLLDDYEARYKLCGVKIVAEMLPRVPEGLLVRTGVGMLMSRSLANCLHHLNSEESASLVAAAIPAALALVLRTTSPGSAQRFEQLCMLLGDGVIGGVWLYSSDNLGVVQASLDALPQLVAALGMGSTRYLKALVPQLVHPLLAAPRDANRTLQISALTALVVVIDECGPRMPRWKGTILNGIGRCWISVDGTSEELVKTQLRHTCTRLETVCPSIREDEYKRLIAVDPSLFRSLVDDETCG